MEKDILDCDSRAQLEIWRSMIDKRLQELRDKHYKMQVVVLTCPKCGKIFKIHKNELDEMVKSIDDNCYDVKFCPDCGERIQVWRKDWFIDI